MKFSFQKFTLINLILTLFLVLGFGLIAIIREGDIVFYVIPPVLVGLLSQMAFYFLNADIKKEKNNEFIYLVMISTFIRLILGILANLLVILLWKSQSTIFIISYFFSYFFLTVFEIYAVISNLRADSKDQK
jgi:hypothetical protein